MLKQVLIATILILDAMARSSATPLLTIEMDSDNSAIIPMLPARPNVGPLIVDGNAKITTTYDTYTDYKIWRADESYRGSHALALRIEREHRQESPKSKIEINIARHDDNALDKQNHKQFILRNDSKHFIGFALKLDKAGYEQPKRWVLHFQVWQCCALTQPPFAFQAIPQPATSANNDIQFSLIRRTDKNLSAPPTSTNGEIIQFLNGASKIVLKRDRWYRIIFELTPGHGPKAGIKMWLDGTQVASYRGAWGYTPNPAESFVNSYAVKLGIYRNAQDASQQIYLDSIRWGLSWSDVNPDSH